MSAVPFGPRLPGVPDVGLLYRLVGNRVRVLRQGRGMTQDELARKVGLTRTSLVQLESGHQHPPLESLYLIAHALDVEIFDVLPTIQDMAVDEASFLDRVRLDPTLSGEERKALITFVREASAGRT